MVHVKTPVRKIMKGTVGYVEVNTDFPTLPLSEWMETSFDLGGHFFLGGSGGEDFAAFSDILLDWWRAYREVDPSLPLFNDFDESEYRYCLPMALHGDEGRGRYKRPIMVFSFQPLITNFNNQTNMKRLVFETVGWSCPCIHA